MKHVHLAVLFMFFFAVSSVSYGNADAAKMMGCSVPEATGNPPGNPSLSGSSVYWDDSDDPAGFFSKAGKVEKVGIIRSVSKADCSQYSASSISCKRSTLASDSRGNSCGNEKFYDQNQMDGTSCKVADVCSTGFLGLGRTTREWGGKWDVSENKCVACSGSVERGVLGTTSSITRSCASDDAEGNNRLESACNDNPAAADVRACDEKSVGDGCAVNGRSGICLSDGTCELGPLKDTDPTPGPECSDPDGSDHFKKGTVSPAKGSSATDFCSGDQLTEWTCGVNDESVQNRVDCKATYGNEYTCSDGRCVKQAQPKGEVCGDGLCWNSETPFTCPQDCGEPGMFIWARHTGCTDVKFGPQHGDPNWWGKCVGQVVRKGAIPLDRSGGKTPGYKINVMATTSKGSAPDIQELRALLKRPNDRNFRKWLSYDFRGLGYVWAWTESWTTSSTEGVYSYYGEVDHSVYGSSKSTVDSFTMSNSPCSGDIELDLIPSHGEWPGSGVKAVVGGLYACDGHEIEVQQRPDCSGGLASPLDWKAGSCTFDPRLGGCEMDLPPLGQLSAHMGLGDVKTLYACIDKDDDRKYDKPGEISDPAEYTLTGMSVTADHSPKGGITPDTTVTITSETETPERAGIVARRNIRNTKFFVNNELAEQIDYFGPDAPSRVSEKISARYSHRAKYPVGTHTYYTESDHSVFSTARSEQGSFNVVCAQNGHCPSGQVCSNGGCISAVRPVVTATHSPTLPAVGQPVTITSTVTGTGITSSRILLDGSAVRNCGSGGCDHAETFSSPGQHTYRARATNPAGTGESSLQTLTVVCTSNDHCSGEQICSEGRCQSDPLAPEGSLVGGLIQTDIVEKRPVTIDASGSRDNVGIVGFRYDWEGDGTPDTGPLGSSVGTHVYTEPGRYTPLVEVRDAAGNAGIASGLTVTVSSCHALDCLDVTSESATRHGATGRETLFDVSVVNTDEFRPQGGTLFVANLCDYDPDECAPGQESEQYWEYGEWEINLYGPEGGEIVDELFVDLPAAEAGQNAAHLALGVTPPTRAPPAPENKPYTFLLRVK